MSETTGLRERALHVREMIVEMCANPEGGHLGGSLSLVEILVTLYHSVLRIDPERPDAPDRDVLVLSKGHGAIGLYAALAERGFFPREWIARYAGPDSELTAHPNSAVPGVEIPTGSLGHGLPIGVGFALGFRLSGSDRRCYVLLGDGELQEGSVWEAAMAAGAYRLDRLTAIVDCNGLQITGRTADVVGVEPLADRWRSFGWTVHDVDGHDLDQLSSVLSSPPPSDGGPTVVLARTVKGKGLPFVEGQTRGHYARLGERQYKRALAALGAERKRMETTS